MGLTKAPTRELPNSVAILLDADTPTTAVTPSPAAT